MKETEDTRELKVRSFDFIEGIQGSRSTRGMGRQSYPITDSKVLISDQKCDKASTWKEERTKNNKIKIGIGRMIQATTALA